MTERERLSPGRGCRLYKAGHRVHYIHARHASREREAAVPALLVDLDGDRLRVWTERGHETYRNHDVAHIRALAGVRGPWLRIQRRLHLVWVGNYPANVVEEEAELIPCAPPRTRRLRDTGRRPRG